jgi:hypothetical protein
MGESAARQQSRSHLWRGSSEICWLPDGRGLLISAKDTVTEPQQIWYLAYPESEAHQITNDLNNYDGIISTGDGLATVNREARTNI